MRRHQSPLLRPERRLRSYTAAEAVRRCLTGKAFEAVRIKHASIIQAMQYFLLRAEVESSRQTLGDKHPPSTLIAIGKLAQHLQAQGKLAWEP